MPLHVDYEFRWKNFRAFKDTGWVKFPALTVLIGPNNSGKTSVIAPLLMLSQTAASPDTSTPLVTRGQLSDAGMLKDFVHDHDLTKNLFFGLRYHIHSEVPKKVDKIGSYPPGAAEITFGQGRQKEDILLKKFELFDVLNRPFLRQNLAGRGLYKLTSDAITRLKVEERNAIANNHPINFLFSPVGALSRRRRTSEKAPSSDYSRDFSMYLNAISAVFEELMGIFRTLSYIGPLRDRPKRYYEKSSELPWAVGSHGEDMANLVRRKMPELSIGLNRWVKKFEFGEQLIVKDVSEELFYLAFADAGGKRVTNIADTGFGASQILPLIVQALAARKDTLTIAEQPEIHLNPRLQYLIADLLVEMASNDRRVIVETHSEHLLLRLRSLVAMNKIAPEKVAIYFVERIDGVSSIRRIPLTANGGIPHNLWPMGFFEDSLRESLALAEAQAQHAKRSQ